MNMEYESNGGQEQSLQEASDRIRKRCRDLWQIAIQQLGAEVFSVRIKEQSDKLLVKYSDTNRRFWYHAMIMSTPPKTVDIIEDFPGEDSVERFLESLAK